MKRHRIIMIMVFALLMGVLQFCTPFLLIEAATSPSEKGTWILVETKKVNRISPIEQGWQMQVMEQVSGLTRLSEKSGDTHYIRQCKWTLPPSQMRPGETVSMTVKAENIMLKKPLHGTLRCAASLDNSNKEDLYLGGESLGIASVSLDAGIGASSTDTKKAKVPSRDYGGKNGRIQIVVRHYGSNNPLGYIYVYRWKSGAGPKPTPGTGQGGTGGGGLTTPGGSQGTPSADASIFTDGTSWCVNNHPVYWVFHSNGIVEASGLWKGSWRVSGRKNSVIVNLAMNQGAKDEFEVVFARDGRSFVAYKNGQVYRNGIRK